MAPTVLSRTFGGSWEKYIHFQSLAGPRYFAPKKSTAETAEIALANAWGLPLISPDISMPRWNHSTKQTHIVHPSQHVITCVSLGMSGTAAINIRDLSILQRFLPPKDYNKLLQNLRRKRQRKSKTEAKSISRKVEDLREKWRVPFQEKKEDKGKVKLEKIFSLEGAFQRMSPEPERYDDAFWYIISLF